MNQAPSSASTSATTDRKYAQFLLGKEAVGADSKQHPGEDAEIRHEGMDVIQQDLAARFRGGGVHPDHVPLHEQDHVPDDAHQGWRWKPGCLPAHSCFS